MFKRTDASFNVHLNNSFQYQFYDIRSMKTIFFHLSFYYHYKTDSIQSIDSIEIVAYIDVWELECTRSPFTNHREREIVRMFHCCFQFWLFIIRPLRSNKMRISTIEQIMCTRTAVRSLFFFYLRQVQHNSLYTTTAYKDCYSGYLLQMYRCYIYSEVSRTLLMHSVWHVNVVMRTWVYLICHTAPFTKFSPHSQNSHVQVTNSYIR